MSRLSGFLGMLWTCFFHPRATAFGKAAAAGSRLTNFILLLFCLSLQVGETSLQCLASGSKPG